MFIVCAGVVLASLDLFIVNVALPDMAKDLGADGLGELSWVLNAYAIVYASLLVLFGRLADRYPREQGFLLGVAIFTLASAACGAATSVGMLVAFRIVQAVGAALLTPTSLGLVLATTSPERRHGAVRGWTAVGGVAAALGPVIGGLLVAASWRWVFFVNVPIGLAAIVVGWRRLPRVPGHAVETPDPFGAGLVTAGIAMLTLGLVEGGAWGWGSARTIAVLAASVLLIGAFVLRCLRVRNPLVDPALFRVRAFSGASAVGLVFSMAFGAMLLSNVLWCQEVWDWSALQTGLAIAPGPLMVPFFALLRRRAADRPVRFRGGDRRRLGDLLRRDRLAGRGVRGDAGLRRRHARRHAADRRRRRPDAADLHGDRDLIVAAAVVRDRFRGGQHDAAGRAGDRRRGLHRGARHPVHDCRGRFGFPRRMGRDRGCLGGVRPRRATRAAGADPRRRPDRRGVDGTARDGVREPPSAMDSAWRSTAPLSGA
jgi:MFS family permease